MNAPLPPFEVVRVVDTREFIEIDDRWVALSGSGDARECDRCDRAHEIHAHVIDANGVAFTVGTGCMDATKPEASKAARGATSAAKKAARHAAAEELVAELVAARDAVAAMTFPADRVRYEMEKSETGRRFHRWTVDDVWVKLAAAVREDDGRRLPPSDREVAERRRAIESSWREARLHEIMPRDAVNKARREADWLERNPS